MRGFRDWFLYQTTTQMFKKLIRHSNNIMLLVIRILQSGATTFFSSYIVCKLNFEQTSRLPVCVG